MERRTPCDSPRMGHSSPAAVVTPPSVATASTSCSFPITSPPTKEPENQTTSLLSEMLSVLGVVNEGGEQQEEVEESITSPTTQHSVVTPNCTEETYEASTIVTHRHSWVTVYCVLLEETLYLYKDQHIAESEAADAERDTFRVAHGNNDLPSPQVADIRLPLDSVASVRSVRQDYGEHCVELSGEKVFVLRAKNREEMNEWMFQFLRAIASVLRGLMDSARSASTLSNIEFSPIRRSMLTATSSFSPRLSLTHGHGRSRRRSHELEDNHDHIVPFPIDGSRLISPLLPRRDSVEPELCMPQTTAPETERPMPYVPPFRRRQYQPRSSRSSTSSLATDETILNATRLGGCADPRFVAGSIMDDQYIPRKASKLRKVRSEPFGYRGDGVDVGAYSDCGPAKETNEDSFMISTNLHESFDGPVWDESLSSKLFCVFDGHGGDHAARFAAEQLTKYIYQEYLLCDRQERIEDTLESILEQALINLDAAFCNFCQEGGRDWDSGSTALVATLIDKRLIVANIGDARGILGRTTTSAGDVARHQTEGWNELSENHGFGMARRHLWKEVTDIHSPSRADETERILMAGGWITNEQEIPVSQLKRMDLEDDEVYKIVERCFADRYDEASQKASAPHRVLQISRTCGDLSVSRALGDRHYKASYNVQEKNNDGVRVWNSSHLYLCYPKEHNRYIAGDLVSNQPEFVTDEIGDSDCEFLLLACDGLWDVLDADDAYRVTHDLLFEKGFSAKQAAARLSELAIHLGSSDNVTVIVVRFL